MKGIQKFIPLVLLFLFSSTFFGQAIQNSISGRVTDHKTGEPLPSVNVYLSGTSIGTTTDNDGKYVLKSIYPAEYELVVSMIGYKSKSKVFFMKRTTNRKVNFKLKERAYVLDDVHVLTEKPEEWYDDLDDFKRLFLGRSKFAQECKIENELFLNFEHTDNDIFIASVDRPLIITNNSLGFEISCELLKFTYNEEDFRLQYIIKPFFKEMKENNSGDREKWETNRLTAHKGSIHHFLKCLTNDNFGENGYKVSIAHQPSTFFAGPQPTVILKSDSLLKPISGSDLNYISFSNYLQVLYMESDEEFRPRSWLRLLIPEPRIDKYGYPTDIVPFETHGYWALLGVANMLPKYYYVSNLNEEK